MSILTNSEFIILNKCRNIVMEIISITENIPKSHIYSKEQILKNAYELLENINIMNNLEVSDMHIKIYIAKINTNISMIDFCLDLFLHRKWLSQNTVFKLTKNLEEVTRMISAWSKGFLKSEN